MLITLNIKSEDIISIVDGFNHWSKLEGATILVSGANGFLPAYMVETILFLNDTVFNKKAKLILIVRSIKNASARFGSDLERSDVLVLEQDISKNINIELNIDYVIHAASFASPKYYSTVPVDVITPNVIGTHNLLELSRQKNIKSLDNHLSFNIFFFEVLFLDFELSETFFMFPFHSSVHSTKINF